MRNLKENLYKGTPSGGRFSVFSRCKLNGSGLRRDKNIYFEKTFSPKKLRYYARFFIHKHNLREWVEFIMLPMGEILDSSAYEDIHKNVRANWVHSFNFPCENKWDSENTGKQLRPQLPTLLIKRLWHRCFTVNFAKFLQVTASDDLQILNLNVSWREGGGIQTFVLWISLFRFRGHPVILQVSWSQCFVTIFGIFIEVEVVGNNT